MYLFLNGVIAMGSCIAALFFMRMARRTSDSFFALFAAAFFIFALERLVLSLFNSPETTTPAVYLMRLAGFLCIIVAIVSKNLQGRPQ